MKGLQKIFSNKKIRYGSYAVLVTVFVIAIAVVLNAVISWDTINNKLKLDLTSSKMYSIGEQTEDVLKDLDKDVIIYGLFDDTKIGTDAEIDPKYMQVVEFLKQYESKSSRVKVEYIDPDKNPSLKNELDPDGIYDIQKTDFVVKRGTKIRILSLYDLFDFQSDQSYNYYVTGSTAEQAFTGAIRYVASDNTPVVYFTEGHNENNLDEEYTTVRLHLERNNYDVKTINLATVEKVPDDAEIVIFASPKTDLTNDELIKIEDYFEAGGKGVFLFDSPENSVTMPSFEDVLAENNVGLNYDMVIENDQNRHIQNLPYDILPDVQNNVITSDLDPGKFYMILPKSRSINILKNDKEWIKTYSLLKTSNQAAGQQIEAGKADTPGPLDLAVAVENNGGMNPVKILVMGNAYFMTDSGMNKHQAYSRNGMIFFLTALNWLQDKEDDIFIPTKEFTVPQLAMDALTSKIIALVVIVLVPVIILGFGVFVWVRRRHL